MTGRARGSQADPRTSILGEGHADPIGIVISDSHRVRHEPLGEKVMPPLNDWTCHRCGASNPSDRDACIACNYPAKTSARESKLAQKSGSSGPLYQTGATSEQAGKTWAAQSWWMKLLDVILTAVMVIGFLVFRFSPGSSGIMGLYVAFLAVGLIWLIHRKRSGIGYRRGLFRHRQ